MAQYDSGMTWDNGAHWDEGDPVAEPKPHKKMNQVKLNLRAKSDPQLVVFTNAHITGTANNPIFTTPTPDVPDFAALAASFSASVDDVATKENDYSQAVVEKDQKRVLLENGLTKRGNYVETTADGDEATILSAGFQVRAATTPIGDLPAPVDFLATMGDMAGEVDLIWSRVTGANAYMIQYREHDAGANWTSAMPSTASKATVAGLDPGKTYAFRVAALGAAGQGPWSDESVKMAP